MEKTATSKCNYSEASEEVEKAREEAAAQAVYLVFGAGVSVFLQSLPAGFKARLGCK